MGIEWNLPGVSTGLFTIESFRLFYDFMIFLFIRPQLGLKFQQPPLISFTFPYPLFYFFVFSAYI